MQQALEVGPRARAGVAEHAEDLVQLVVLERVPYAFLLRAWRRARIEMSERERPKITQSDNSPIIEAHRVTTAPSLKHIE